MVETPMKLVVNGTEQQVDIPGSSTFEDIMKAVNQAAVKPGNAITKVSLNGEDITGLDWQAYTPLTLNQIEQLEIETGDLMTLAKEMLVSLNEFIGDLSAELNRISAKFREGEDLYASELYSQSLDGIQVVNFTTPKILVNLGIDLREENFHGKSLKDVFADLDDIISEMLNAQERQDWILLADLIEYELVPHLIDRQKILSAVKEKSGECVS